MSWKISYMVSAPNCWFSLFISLFGSSDSSCESDHTVLVFLWLISFSIMFSQTRGMDIWDRLTDVRGAGVGGLEEVSRRTYLHICMVPGLRQRCGEDLEGVGAKCREMDISNNVNNKKCKDPLCPQASEWKTGCGRRPIRTAFEMQGQSLSQRKGRLTAPASPPRKACAPPSRLTTLPLPRPMKANQQKHRQTLLTAAF